MTVNHICDPLKSRKTPWRNSTTRWQTHHDLLHFWRDWLNDIGKTNHRDWDRKKLVLSSLMNQPPSNPVF